MPQATKIPEVTDNAAPWPLDSVQPKYISYMQGLVQVIPKNDEATHAEMIAAIQEYLRRKAPMVSHLTRCAWTKAPEKEVLTAHFSHQSKALYYKFEGLCYREN